MPRLNWLADELRRAGLRVVEVDGWEQRGNIDFRPAGVTWHATAGSRAATAQTEVRVILRGSTSAPPPIAQLMIFRDGVIYVCAAGRCNHNKVGWAGPNRGLGNTRLLGIEMANDNRGEPWPAVQLTAARRATAAIMRKLRADPAKRLAGHYEHQPFGRRPSGETSTKTDPVGINMRQERVRVAGLMRKAGPARTLEVMSSPV
ncbi:N-acetylmuramoyl-L-alanine amidase [Actinoplanes sp. DH11]|uniref:peptidoglycan recognition protein family protein n=1 Tax=Actinoplanes sp. DH11 TaxID=2857011 RepID=UPI001E43A6FA|nr:N-acetylmuramoyl-L-alanine amidase [Actinoplanes sp. DH11]